MRIVACCNDEDYSGGDRRVDGVVQRLRLGERETHVCHFDLVGVRSNEIDGGKDRSQEARAVVVDCLERPQRGAWGDAAGPEACGIAGLSPWRASLDSAGAGPFQGDAL